MCRGISADKIASIKLSAKLLFTTAACTRAAEEPLNNAGWGAGPPCEGAVVEQFVPSLDESLLCPSFPGYLLKMARKTTKKTRIFYPYRTPVRSPEKKEKRSIKQGIRSSQGKKTQGIEFRIPKNNKERKDRVPFPNAVVLSAVGRRFTQMRAKERRCAPANERIRKRAQTKERKKSAKGCKIIEFFRGRPRGGNNFTSLSRCSRPLI